MSGPAQIADGDSVAMAGAAGSGTGVSSLDLPGDRPPVAGSFPEEPPRTTRRPSVTQRCDWRPKGPHSDPAFGIHVRLVFADADATRPHAVYLTPTRSAAKHGSELHARCEEIGMLVSWCLKRGMTLADMEAQFKPVSPEGGQGLGLFAVAAARMLAGAAP